MWKSPDNSRLPSREEIHQTHQALAALDNELAPLHSTLARNAQREQDCEQRIALLQNELRSIREDKNKVSERISALESEKDRRRAWIAVHRRLPREILAEIFIWHVKIDNRAPLVVSAVCKLWRSTALSTPRLWAYPRITDQSLPLPLLKLWLERASNAPIHLHLEVQDVTNDLLELYSNVYCLKFRPWPTHLHNKTFSKLHKLMLEHEDASLEHLRRDVFSSMPNLKQLHLHWFRLSRRPVLEWAWDLPPLDELHFAGRTWAWVDAVELVAPSLKKLALDIGDVPTPVPSNVTIRRLHLPKLEYFAYGPQSQTLLVNDSARIPIVARILDAPNLKTFEDHTVMPLEFSLPVSENWNFLLLENYIGRTSRELGYVKQLFPHIRRMAFLVDPESGVLDVTALIDEARNGMLTSLEAIEMFQSATLLRDPLVQQSLKEYREVRGRDLYVIFHPGRHDTPYQQCFFGFPCCSSYRPDPVKPQGLAHHVMGINGTFANISQPSK
ncbi:SubName: Full=Uncharacterized protein {ECO:0000313/EMBL:CCA66996.1} [Serendipita indica DSM 11827]|uniref:Uncharacterized protein n=1 Tax=Serendipita indica (strain DSM 11827) TaxID=1109443 RepID=G4T6P2_SERID|nr:SubName: Full=Uncharacterized protein {ECO:0000313/EMBL:CCA66996.1} [Serendipita indica DSM 11827]CCA66996.1 hypothetical protein PIIN_00833 [Serendipita indica DSM 11827]